jgi:hypothetical protein
MPRNPELGEQHHARVAYLWQQGPVGELGGQAEVERAPRPAITDPRRLDPRRVGKGSTQRFPSRGPLIFGELVSAVRPHYVRAPYAERVTAATENRQTYHPFAAGVAPAAWMELPTTSLRSRRLELSARARLAAHSGTPFGAPVLRRSSRSPTLVAARAGMRTLMLLGVAAPRPARRGHVAPADVVTGRSRPVAGPSASSRATGNTGAARRRRRPVGRAAAPRRAGR